MVTETDLPMVSSKSMEKIVVPVEWYLESNKILSSHLYGFWSNCSNEDHLLLINNDVGKCIDKIYIANLMVLEF